MPPWYYHFYNAIAGPGQGDEHVLDEALAWYRENGVRCRVGVSPFNDARR